VLVQHLVTLACGDGFQPDATLRAVCQTVAYADLSATEFAWILEFITQGGKCLSAYPRYKKVVVTEQGTYRVTDATIARLHRMGIGTITSNQSMQLVYTTGKKIGTVEESFISKLEKGDVFFFAGRQLEFFMVKDMMAYVKGTSHKSTVTPIWGGGNLAISDTLSTHLRQEIAAVAEWLDPSPMQPHPQKSPLNSDPPESPLKRGTSGFSPFQGGQRRIQVLGEGNPELNCIMPLLATQRRLSHLPKATELLIETCKTREGQHLYVFPFEGRFVHEGLGFLWGYRFASQQRSTFTISVNDYGFEILAPKDYPFAELFSTDFFAHDRLYEDICASLNISELTGRKFRGIAQVAGLVFKGYPGAKKTASQLQVSSSLIYEVFTKYEPDNLLLKQAERDVLEEQLEVSRLTKTLSRLCTLTLIWKETHHPSPFAFPLLVERLGSRLSNESLLERTQRMKQQWGN
jgi:ATP-dependent Lhr-like helicase